MRIFRCNWNVTESVTRRVTAVHQKGKPICSASASVISEKSSAPVSGLVTYKLEHKKTPCKIFFALQGVLLNIRIIKYYNYCNPVIKITNDIIVITVQPMYLPAISQSDGSAFSTFRI